MDHESEEKFRKEFPDAYVSDKNRLSKQSVGFIGGNRGRRNDLGVAGLVMDFEAGGPERICSQEDPVGLNETKAVEDQDLSNDTSHPDDENGSSR